MLISDKAALPFLLLQGFTSVTSGFAWLNCYVYYDCGFELVEVCKGFVV